LAVTNAIKSTRPIDKVGLKVLRHRERLERLKVLNRRCTFAILQVLDLLTTLAAFRVGAFAVNPIVAHLTVSFGRFSGVLISTATLTYWISMRCAPAA
jgi:hypothetical protein